VADDGDSEDEEYTDDDSGSDYDDEEAGSEAGASKAPADAGFDFQSLPGELTFSQFLAQNSNPEFMDVLNGHPFAMRAMRITWQKEVEAARNGYGLACIQNVALFTAYWVLSLYSTCRCWLWLMHGLHRLLPPPLPRILQHC
jgi:hypothetical protein